MADQVDSTSTTSALPHLITDSPAAEAGDGKSLAGDANEAGSRLQQLRQFLQLVRFSHTVFALPFAGLACVLALTTRGIGELSFATIVIRLVGVLLCMVFARSAAMAFNRLIDAELDARNPRTANRHLPAGQLDRRQVWTFFTINCIVFGASCLLFLPNWLPIAFSLPVLAWICGYSYAKRFTSAAHLWLGSALALSPICAWVALRGEAVLTSASDVLPACGLALAIAGWVAGFDIIYACQDADFDRKAGLRSVPARFGIAGGLRIAAVLHMGMLIVLAVLPLLFPQLSLGWLYYLALTLVGSWSCDNTPSLVQMTCVVLAKHSFRLTLLSVLDSVCSLPSMQFGADLGGPTTAYGNEAWKSLAKSGAVRLAGGESTQSINGLDHVSLVNICPSVGSVTNNGKLELFKCVAQIHRQAWQPRKR